MKPLAPSGTFAQQHHHGYRLAYFVPEQNRIGAVSVDQTVGERKCGHLQVVHKQPVCVTRRIFVYKQAVRIDVHPCWEFPLPVIIPYLAIRQASAGGERRLAYLAPFQRRNATKILVIKRRDVVGAEIKT